MAVGEASAMARAAAQCEERRDLSCAATLYQSAADDDPADDDAEVAGGIRVNAERAEAMPSSAGAGQRYSRSARDYLKRASGQPILSPPSAQSRDAGSAPMGENTGA